LLFSIVFSKNAIFLILWLVMRAHKLSMLKREKKYTKMDDCYFYNTR
jgi:hypothetical protein